MGLWYMFISIVRNNMTEMIYAVIDNHNKKKGKSYNIVFHTKDVRKLVQYTKAKGL